MFVLSNPSLGTFALIDYIIFDNALEISAWREIELTTSTHNAVRYRDERSSFGSHQILSQVEKIATIRSNSSEEAFKRMLAGVVCKSS
jgi:hypothetical protein